MLRKWLKWISSVSKKEKLYKHKYVNDIPEKIAPYIIYIIRNESYYWQAVMVCPCGCKKVLNMNLMKEHHPSWKIKFNQKGIISLHPSINRVVGCKSHFYVREGKIVWT